MKKVLALVLSFALVFSTFGMAFADTTTTTPAAAPALSADATICADLGMLKGATGTVDAAYTATTPTKIQSAIMVLRLKGLEAEALAFTGTENFADAASAAWAKPVMAYLKAHPELGFVGSNNNFAPTANITAQQYYKVMLEALGYKQNTAEVVGDFTWDGTIAFAATKGLTKAAAATNFTIDNLAAATVETLKGAVKGGTTTLVATLVAAGKVDAAKATKAGIYTAAATAAAEVDTVKATANDKVEVTFTADVDKAFAETAANFAVVVKGSTTALEVKSAALSGTSVVVLTTAAQTGGTAYAMTVNGKAYNFAGAAKSTAVLELDTVTCIDTNTVEVVFKKAVDRASAEDVANYVLTNGATVKKAELWIGQDDSRKTVKLTTEGVANNKVYQVKVQNVKSADGVAIKTVSKSFTGKTDTKAPSIYTLTVVNNQRVKLVITDDHGVDKAAAEKVENYSITAGSDTLKIDSVVAKDVDGDDYGYLEVIEINTDTMTSGTSYKLTISNLVDGSVSANVISKVLTKDFKGVAIDKTAPKLNTVTPMSDGLVEVTFTDTNRLDNATLTDINNYTFDKDITVTGASIVRASDADLALAKTVLVATTAMEKNKSYKLTVANVADEFGNVMTSTTRTVVGIDEDIAAPKVDHVTFVDANTVQVWFNERVDAATANDPANYSLSGSLGTVTKAEVSSKRDYKRVTLTVPTMTNNKSYTITINNVKDRVGNAMADVKAYFVATSTEVDTDKPEIASIDVLSKNEVRVTFDEPIVKVGTPALTVTYTGSTAATNELQAVGQLLDDLKTVVYQTNDVSAPGIWNLGATEYTITALTGIKDKADNTYSLPTDKPTFYGTTSANVRAEVSTVEQVDAKTIRVVFTKPVKAVDGTAAFLEGSTARTFNVTVDWNGDNTNEAESTVDFEITGLAKMAYDVDYKVDFTSEVVDYMGAGAIDDTDTADTVDTTHKTVFRSYIEDKDGPTIDYIEALNTNTIKVVYNENLMNTAAADLGTYKIVNAAGATVATSTNAKRDGDNYNTMTFTTSAALTADTAYTLKPVVGAKDIAGNIAKVNDISFDFVGSTVTLTDYIKGVEIKNSSLIRVKATKDFQAANIASIVVAELVEAGGDPVTGPNANLTKTITLPGDDDSDNVLDFIDDWTYANVDLKSALKANTTYKVTVTYADASTLSYEFTGLTDNGGIVYTKASDIITFSGWNTTDYVVRAVYTDGANVYYSCDITVATPAADVVGSDIDLTTALTAARMKVNGTGAALAANVPADAAITLEVHRYDTVNGVEPAALYTIDTVR